MVDRFRAALRIVAKGSIAPFDRISDFGALGAAGDKLKLPYRDSAWVMRAIKFIAAPIAAVNVQFAERGQTGAENLMTDPELAQFWAKPARTAACAMTFYDFVEATVGWLKLAGEAFWILDDTWSKPFPGSMAERNALVIARPDRMRVILQRGALAGWDFMDGNGTHHALLPEQVIHPAFWNPYDEFRGLGEYEAAKLAAEADYLAGKFNLNLMRNNGDQGVYIVAKNGIPEDAQRKQIVEQLREKKMLSLQGIFKPMFLSNDVAIEDPKVQTPDASFLATRMENKHEIFIALGVPPSMADVTASYSIGSASDRFRLIEDTCMPLAERLANHIEQVEMKRSGRDVNAIFDWSKHSVMQQVRLECLKAADGLWAKGMPMSEINDYLRLGLPEFEGWDVGYLPFSVAPVGSESVDTSGAYAETPKSVERGGGVSSVECRVSNLKGALRQRIEGQQGFQTKRPEKEKARWRDQMAKRREVSKAFESRFRMELFRARQIVLRNIEARGTKAVERESVERGSVERGSVERGSVEPGREQEVLAHERQQKAAAADFMFDLEQFRNSFLAAMRKVAATGLQIAGRQLFEEVGKNDPFSMPPAKAIEFLRNRENKLSGVADEVHDRIKAALEEGLNAGDSIKDLSDRVRGEFNELGRGRATVIAMTETSAAYGVARDEAMTQAGIQEKEWLTSGNANVRPAHADANGQRVGIDEPFQVGGEELRHPGDPEGSPENVINCHCVAVPVEGEA